MPVMDGFQATSAVRAAQDPRKAKVPIVAMTAHALKDDRQRCLSAGMDDYLSKPINAQELIELVERVAERNAMWHPPVEQPAEAPSGREAAPISVGKEVFNPEEGRARCFGTSEMFWKMAVFFFKDSARVLDRIHTALQRGDAKEIARAAHHLRGTVVYLGAQSTAEAAEQVERLATAGDLKGVAEAVHPLESQIELLKDELFRFCQQ
jgi:DNA-binding response OmpR family regulator